MIKIILEFESDLDLYTLWKVLEMYKEFPGFQLWDETYKNTLSSLLSVIYNNYMKSNND